MYLKKELYDLIRTDEKIFDFIQESALDGLWYWDLESPEKKWMNAKFWTVLGYDPDKLTHKSSSWQDIVNQDDLRLAKDNLINHCENPNHAYDQVVRYTHKDGSTVWMHCRGMAICDKDGNAIRILGALQDISDIKSSEQEFASAKEKAVQNEEILLIRKPNEQLIAELNELRIQSKKREEELENANRQLTAKNQQLIARKKPFESSEGKYRALFETMILGVVYHSADGSIISANKAAQRILGLTLDQMQGRTSMDPRWKSIHEDGSDFPGDTHPAMTALKTGKVVSNVVMGVFNPKTGMHTWISINAVPQFNPGDSKPFQVYVTFEDITKRMQAEASLKESEEKFRAIYENINDAVFIHKILPNDEPGNFLHFNKAALKMLGYTSEELKSMSPRELDDPDKSRRDIPEVIRQLKKQSMSKFDAVQIAKDGRKIDIEVNAVVIKIGKEDFIVSVCRDITEMKASQRILTEKEQFLSAIYKNISHSIFVVDVLGNEDFRYAGLNPQHEKVTGFSTDFIKGKKPEDLLPKEAALNICKRYAKCVSLKQVITYEEWLPFKGKQTCWETILNPRLNESGDVCQIIGTSQEITERKQAEEALKESEIRLRNLFNSMHDIVFEMDYNGTYLNIAPTAPQLMVKPAEKTLGKTLHDTFPKQQADIFLQFIQHCIDKNIPDKIIYPIDFENKTIWFEGRANPIGNKRVLYIASDITERKKSEEKMKQLLRDQEILLNNDPSFIIYKDTENNIIKVTDTVAKMTNLRKEEIEGKPSREIYPAMAEQYYKDDQEVISSGIPKLGIIEPLPASDGSTKWLLTDKIPVKDNENEVTGIIVFSTDITDLKETQDILQAREKRLQEAERIGKLGHVDWNVAEQRYYWSDEIFRIYGLDPSKGVPGYREIMNLHTPESAAKLEAAVVEALQQGKDYDLDLDAIMPSGKKKILQIIGKTIKDDAGNVTNIIGTVQDITERKVAEKALEDTVKFREKIFNLSPAFIITLNPDGTVNSMNQSMLKKLGYSLEEVLGENYLDKFIPEPDKTELAQIFERHSGKNEISKNENHVLTKEGKSILIEWHGTPIFNDLNELEVFLGIGIDINERKQSEMQILQQQYLLQKAQEIGSIGTWELDIVNNHLIWTEETYKIFGLPKGTKMSLELFLSLIHPDDSDYVKEKWAAALNHEKYDIEHRILVEGKIKWVREKAYLEFNDKGDALKSIGFVQDITERKKAEEKLRDSEAKFKAAFQTSPDAVSINNLNGEYVEINEGFTRLTGFTDKDVIGKPSSEISIWAVPTDREKMYTGLQNNGLIENLESLFRAKDGTLIPALMSAKIIYLKEEPHILSVTRAIVDRKKMEQELIAAKEKAQKSEEKIRNLSEMQSIILRMASGYINMPQELVESSINNSLKELGEFVQADRAYIFDYDWTRNVCKNTFEWCNEGINPEIDNLQNVPNEVIDYWVEAHKNGREINIEDVMQLPQDDGVRRILEPQGVKSVLALPMMKLDKCIGFIGFDSVRKIHKYSEREKTLLKIFSEILVNIGNRIELEKNLLQAKEKAEESDRLKSAFLTNMSHEIRTPMNGILGFTDLLKEPQLSGEEKNKYISVIEKSGARMLNTINDIIDISRIEAGQMKVEKSGVLINEILEEQYNFFYQQAKSKGLELIYKPTLSDAETHIVTDKRKLEGILTNLIKNAIKYTDQGEITMACSRKKELDKEVLEFYVKDTGIGIPANRISAVFNRFEQADIEDTRAFEGSGLGLSITKSYVEMLDGEISVSSKEGSGSTFTFRIPYIKQFVKEHDTNENIDKEAQTPLRNLSVIIAEDDEVSVSLFKTVFLNTFQKISFTGTGNETISLLRDNPDTDLILMDIKMPDKNGFAATREIRKFNRDVVIIAQTAFGLAGDREKAIEAGCNDYIAKPINKRELQEIIQRYFGE